MTSAMMSQLDATKASDDQFVQQPVNKFNSIGTVFGTDSLAVHAEAFVIVRDFNAPLIRVTVLVRTA